MVAVETLALAIRQNPEIIGIKIGGEETKLLQYADYTTTVLSDIRDFKIQQRGRQPERQKNNRFN